MIFAIDHFVLSADPLQAPDLLGRLRQAGFVANDFVLRFDDSMAQSESLSYRGGGMVEVLHSLDPANAAANWFAEVPRIIGIGFASDAFEADTDWGADQEEGHWTMDQWLPLPDSSSLHIVAAGPHRHLSEFYVFVMDRPGAKLQFSEVPAEPRLVSIKIAGSDAMIWRRRLQRWLRLPDTPVLKVGEVELSFEEQSNPGVRVSPTFALARAQPGSIPLARSSINFVPQATVSAV